MALYGNSEAAGQMKPRRRGISNALMGTANPMPAPIETSGGPPPAPMMGGPGSTARGPGPGPLPLRRPRPSSRRPTLTSPMKWPPPGP